MPTITTTIRLEVTALGTQSIKDKQRVEAYDSVDVTVPVAGAEVAVQPSGAGKVTLFLLTADTYSSDLTYSVAGGASDVPLDGPQLLLGAGAVGLLGAAPTTLTFTNNTAAEVDVHIRIGRDAT